MGNDRSEASVHGLAMPKKIVTNGKACQTIGMKNMSVDSGDYRPVSPVAFGRKLDYIMRILGLSNSRLSKRVPISASYVSRLRSGERKLPANPPFLSSLAEFLAATTARSGRRTEVFALLGVKVEESAGADDPLVPAIERWLVDDTPLPERTDEGTDLRTEAIRAWPYYGNEGKRMAVDRFLSAVLSAPTPQTLFLYSDEPMGWIVDDPVFLRHWASLLHAVVEKGVRITIIHTIKRDFNEMYHAISRWIPLHLSGAIDSYYCPRIHDGLFHRTMFIAPKTACILSSSIQGKCEGMMNLYLSDTAAIRSAMKEYRNFLHLCRPLVVPDHDMSLPRKVSTLCLESADFMFVQYPLAVYPRRDGFDIRGADAESMSHTLRWLDSLGDILATGHEAWFLAPQLSEELSLQVFERLSPDVRGKLRKLFVDLEALSRRFPTRIHFHFVAPEELLYSVVMVGERELYMSADIEDAGIFFVHEQATVQSFWNYYMYLATSRSQDPARYDALFDGLLRMLGDLT